MESPSSHKSAELVIKRAITSYNEGVLRGVYGASMAHTIAEALRASGHINDQEEPEQGPEAAFGPKHPEPASPVWGALT